MKKLFVIFLIITVNLSLHAQFTVIDTSLTHTNAALWSSVFTDDSTGYVVGGGSGGEGVILKTTNAGASWNIKIVSSCLKSVFFTSKDTGYAAGENTTVMKTIDAGATWTYLNTSIVSATSTATSIRFINNDTGLVGFINGSEYTFLKTFDGGATWINNISDPLYVSAMSLVKPRTIFVLGGNLLSISTNLCTSSTTDTLLPNSFGYDLDFLNDSVGFVTLDRIGGTPCNYYSSVMKTTDGGHTWNTTDFNCDGWFTSIVFPSNTTGYMLSGGKLWKTTDAGNTWNYISYTPFLDSGEIAIGVNAFSLVCTDTNTCYLLTNYGIIIKTTNGGGNVGINELQSQNESLSIYPNPATNSFTLEFENQTTQDVLIEVKNVLGQTIKTISNSSFSKGANKIEIDVSGFTNGIYFLQLQNDNRVINKKFIKQ